MGASLGNGKGFVSEINVTPFVDVMLVLLIIFMVTAPMLTEGLDLDLPKTQAVQTLPTDANNLVLSVTNSGRIFLEDRETDLASLEDVLRQAVTSQGKQLFLQADKDVNYGLVVDVMGRARQAGVDKLGIVAEAPPKGSGQAAPQPSGTVPARTPNNSPNAGRSN